MGDLPGFHQLGRNLSELVVGEAELALRLDVFDTLLRLRSRLLGRRLCLVEKAHDSLLQSPRMLPNSPLPLRSPLPAAASSTRRAVREKGRV